MALLEAYITGHLGIAVEELDYGGLDLVTDSIEGFKEVGRRIAAIKPDTIILTTPHNVRYSDYFHISPGEGADGIMKGPWGKSITMHVDYDTEFVAELVKEANAAGIPTGTDYEVTSALDHGTIIPLKFVNDNYTDYKLVRICLSGLPFEDHYRLGQLITDISQKLNRKTVFIASGDLSHRLKPESPYGLAQEGLEFEEKAVKTMEDANFVDFMTYDLNFLETVAECGLRSFIIMSGALNGMNVEHKLLAHDHSYGVGCAIAWYRPTDENPEREFLKKYAAVKEHETRVIPLDTNPYTSLAKFSGENYAATGEYAKFPRFLPAKMINTKYGVYVEILKDGKLRSAFGLETCKHKNTAEEIFYNSATASALTTAFVPVKEQELPSLTYKVYLLHEPVKIATLDEIDPEKQALLAVSGYRRHFIMPAAGRSIGDVEALLAENGLSGDELSFFVMETEIHS